MAPHRAKGYHGLGYRDDQCYYQTQILISYFSLYITDRSQLYMSIVFRIIFYENTSRLTEFRLC